MCVCVLDKCVGALHIRVDVLHTLFVDLRVCCSNAWSRSCVLMLQLYTIRSLAVPSLCNGFPPRPAPAATATVAPCAPEKVAEMSDLCRASIKTPDENISAQHQTQTVGILCRELLSSGTPVVGPRSRGPRWCRFADSAMLGCGQMGSTLLGQLMFDRLGKKVRPVTFGKIKVG